MSQLWEGFVWFWNHDSFPITLSQVLLCLAALSPSHYHCHSSLSFSFYSGYSWQSCLWSVKDKRTKKKKDSIRWKSVGSKTTLATMTLTFFFTISLFVCVPKKKKVYWKLGVSPIKDFHSRIGIFKSCRYSTDSRNISLGVWSKYITKSQVRHSQTLNKIINAKLLFLPPFFMSWTLRSETFLYTKGLFLSNIVHKSV